MTPSVAVATAPATPVPATTPDSSCPPTPRARRAEGPESEPTLAARLLIGLVRVYQLARRGRPSPCRYLPSCSEYAAVALDQHGAVRGSWLAVRRLCRCHPWGGYGADPVPEPSGVRNPS